MIVSRKLSKKSAITSNIHRGDHFVPFRNDLLENSVKFGSRTNEPDLFFTKNIIVDIGWELHVAHIRSFGPIGQADSKLGKKLIAPTFFDSNASICCFSLASRLSIRAPLFVVCL